MGMWTAGSELRRRRMKWWQQMHACPDDYVVLRAALCGKMEIDEGRRGGAVGLTLG